MKIKLSTLSNGLTVISINLPGFESTIVSAYVNAGSANELEHENGIAHFNEHMFFKTTTNRTTLQIASDIENMGSNTNAYTSCSKTCYYIKGLKENLSSTIDILGDMFCNHVFNTSDIDVERNVILQEIAQNLDDPVSVAYDKLGLITYPSHPAGKTILGDPEFIKHATRDNFLDFVSRNYVSNNTLVIGSGGIGSHDDFCNMVEKSFKNISTGPKISITPPVFNSNISIHTGGFEQVNILIGFKSVSSKAKNFLNHALFSSSFGSGMSSPLFQEIREKRGLVYSTYTMLASEHNYGNFIIAAGTTLENLDTFINVVCDELIKFTNNPSLTDLNRSKIQARSAYKTLKEKPDSISAFIANKFFETGKIVLPNNKYISKIDNITPNDLTLAGKEILQSGPSISIVGPVDSTVDYLSMVKSKLLHV